jgi:hypothetical protein
MARTWTTAGLAVILLMLVFLPRNGEAATWSFSTHRVQMAEDPKPDQPISETPAPTVAEGKKNIGKGVMFSLVIPGAGQLYTGSWVRAVPWFAVEVVGWAMFAKYHGQGKDKTTEFEKFAGTKISPNHFDYNAYMLREYQIATNPNFNANLYTGDLSEWKNEDWSVRQSFFENAPGFTHDILTGDLQQYYEMIGKYINQFGFGWRDTYDWQNVDVNVATTEHIWAQSGDDANTAAFDGPYVTDKTGWFWQYRNMRGEANKLLDKGNVAMEVVLVNHVLSALDAAFAVRRHNKHFAQNPLGGMKLHYDAKTIDGELARVMTLSVPLD